MEKKYTVFVGGSEMNDYLLPTHETAKQLANEWIAEGYSDVAIIEINN